mmetsp:Transcript_8025/g.22077  ORF Transcript_8025/g.22077 Transcript_8025/m.22077 type:complete len:271 (+) Transcript_8025:354-1166(+)
MMSNTRPFTRMVMRDTRCVPSAGFVTTASSCTATNKSTALQDDMLKRNLWSWDWSRKLSRRLGSRPVRSRHRGCCPKIPRDGRLLVLHLALLLRQALSLLHGLLPPLLDVREHLEGTGRLARGFLRLERRGRRQEGGAGLTRGPPLEVVVGGGAADPPPRLLVVEERDAAAARARVAERAQLFVLGVRPSLEAANFQIALLLAPADEWHHILAHFAVVAVEADEVCLILVLPLVCPLRISKHRSTLREFILQNRGAKLQNGREGRPPSRL